jgi:protein-disulfide isomerase
MTSKWDTLLTAVLVLCAVSTTSAVMYRQFSPLSRGITPQKPRFIEDWKSNLASGVRLGQKDAPVQIIEFADFECPYCRDFHKELHMLRDHFTDQVTLTFVHFPLPGHRFAMPAARVAECAREQGRFEAMYDRLFDEQESFGLKSWTEYASAADVSNLPAFQECIERKSPSVLIDLGRQLAAKLDVKGTPTVIINGWMLATPPSANELDTMIKAVLAGKTPVSGTHTY